MPVQVPAQLEVPASVRAGARPTEADRYSTEALVRERTDEVRRRLKRSAGLPEHPPRHYSRPAERPFTAEEREKVTLLFGGLTWKHERLIQAALQSCGYRAEPLPQPDLAGCLLGRQYGSNGLCNPAYFTVGNLVQYLLRLEAQGLSRKDILDRYVFFTAGTCGPCRFGMYESEYRLALRNAGFDGFRVLLFSQDDGVKAKTGSPGFQLSLHLGLGALNAFSLADVIHDFAYAVRPYEVEPGGTDRAVAEAIEEVARRLRARREVTLDERLPAWIVRQLSSRPGVARTTRILSQIHDQLYSSAARELAEAAAAQLSDLEVDRLRVKPVVKIAGEFWAQTTEGDGNFNMFAFLEREGAQVLIEPLAGWLMYLLHQAKSHLLYRRGLAIPQEGSPVVRLRARGADDWRLLKRRLLFWVAKRMFLNHYNGARKRLGNVSHELPDQQELARLAQPFYHTRARGGEGHLEVAKNLYYTTRHGAHMVVSLKPFGCLPSTQSDGVQSSVVTRFKDMVFVPIETAADGELNAHSRVQMALVEASARAQAEFDHALAATGRSLDEIRAYVMSRPELRKAGYQVPHRHGVTGTAANFVLHVSDLMEARGATAGSHGRAA